MFWVFWATQNNYYKKPKELGTKIVYNIYFVTNKLWLVFFTYQTFCIRWETMEWFQWQNSFRCEVFDVIPSLLEKIAQLDLMAVLISSFLVYRMCISCFLYIFTPFYTAVYIVHRLFVEAFQTILKLIYSCLQVSKIGKKWI